MGVSRDMPAVAGMCARAAGDTNREGTRPGLEKDPNQVLEVLLRVGAVEASKEFIQGGKASAQSHGRTCCVC